MTSPPDHARATPGMAPKHNFPVVQRATKVINRVKSANPPR
jgi:hypothetical protein